MRIGHPPGQPPGPAHRHQPLVHGIDGSRVLTYFITTTDPKQEDGSFGTTYNGMLHPAAIAGGLCTLAVVGLWTRLFPSLWTVNRFEELE